jgi:hypothetical protein
MSTAIVAADIKANNGTEELDGSWARNLHQIYFWCHDRAPNMNELWTTAPVTAVIEMYFDGWLRQFGDSNPTNKNFIRDLQKLPSNILAWRQGNKLGGTAIKYDVGNVYSQAAKGLCKLTIIKIAENAFHLKELKAASFYANYGCEPVSRLFSLVSQIRQKEKASDVGYYQFLQEKFGLYLVGHAIFEGTSKNFMSQQIGALFGYSGLEVQLHKLGNYVQSGLLSSKNGVQILFSNIVAANGKEILPIMQDKIAVLKSAQLNTYANQFFLYSLEWLTKSGIGVVATTLLATPTRIFQDGAGLLFSWLQKQHHEYQGVNKLDSNSALLPVKAIDEMLAEQASERAEVWQCNDYSDQQCDAQQLEDIMPYCDLSPIH